MTDKRDDNEFGFNADEVDALGRLAENEEAAELELELNLDSIKDDESVKSQNEHSEYLSKAFESDGSALESDNLEIPARNKSSSGIIVGVAGVAITLAVAVGGYFFVAPMVLGDSQAATGSFQSAPIDGDVRNDLSFSQQNNQQVSSGQFSEDAGSEQNVPDDFGGFSGESSELGEALSQGNDDQFAFTGGDDLEQSTHRESFVPESDEIENDMYGSFDDGDDVVISPQISDEERMYDNILAEASTIDAPHEAIKIDRNVVTMELQIKRISQVELEIASTRKSMSDIVSVIDDVRKQTASIAKSIESNKEDNQRFSNEIRQLSAKVEGQIELQKADIAALKEDVKTLAQKPVAQAVAKSTPVVAPKPAPVKKPAVSQEKASPVVAQKTVNLPAPKPQPVAVRAPTPRPSTSNAACAATKVSDNWRVKGVTPSSAYVERMQDGQGLLLKAGVSLPGFGTVKSFNPVERSVCTTSGLVRR